MAKDDFQRFANPRFLRTVDVVEQDADFLLYDAEDSAKPAGEVVARFSLLAIAPTGSPWAP